MSKMNSSNGLKSYLIFLITISLQFATGEENSIDYQQYSISNIATPRVRQKRFTDHACGKLPLGQLNIPYYRNSLLPFLQRHLLEVLETLKTPGISTDNEYERFTNLRQAEAYEYLKSIHPDAYPNFSEWYHILLFYKYTFDYLLKHQKETHKLPETQEDLVIQEDLEQLRTASETVLCRVKIAASYTEENPTFNLLTAAEKEIITDKLKTATSDRQGLNVALINLMITRVLFKHIVNNMARGVQNCTNDCDCVKGTGECDLLIDIETNTQ